MRPGCHWKLIPSDQRGLQSWCLNNAGRSKPFLYSRRSSDRKRKKKKNKMKDVIILSISEAIKYEEEKERKLLIQEALHKEENEGEITKYTAFSYINRE
jgi:hypothetical protein